MLRNSMLPLASRSRHLADVAHSQLRLGRDQGPHVGASSVERPRLQSANLMRNHVRIYFTNYTASLSRLSGRLP